MEKPITPPADSKMVIKNPFNDETLRLAPFIWFINQYGEDAKYAANVIEFTANKEDKSNPDIDLTMSTDLLRDLAKCLREMAE